MKVYQKIAGTYQAILNCQEAKNGVWEEIHLDTILYIIEKHLPSGSGLDSGVSLDFDKSTPEKLVFDAPFHHMNDMGYYTKWSNHQVVVTPSLQFGFNLKITGKNENNVKEYLSDIFGYSFDLDL